MGSGDKAVRCVANIITFMFGVVNRCIYIYMHGYSNFIKLLFLFLVMYFIFL